MATVAVGSVPVDVAITPDGAFAYVITDVVVVIATARNAPTGTITAGLSPKGVAITGIAATGISGIGSIPEDYALSQNYPNPFNPETEIRFQLPQASHVVLKIFNTLGQEIRTLTHREYEVGFHRVRWDAKDSKGNLVSSGIYLYQLQAGSFSQIRKMTLLR